VAREGEQSTDEPLTKKQIEDDKQSVTATFSGSWAEKRIVRLVIDDDHSVLVEASFDTDYGHFVGSVDANKSFAHTHNNCLCFDLRVIRLDRSSAEERWTGRLNLE